jgi:hypothetical protein
MKQALIEAIIEQRQLCLLGTISPFLARLKLEFEHTPRQFKRQLELWM